LKFARENGTDDVLMIVGVESGVPDEHSRIVARLGGLVR